jgi:hypothetical protein
MEGLEPSRNRVVVPARQATQPGGIGSLESILELLQSFKIRALAGRCDNPIPTQFLTFHRLF